jgi:hypothetical protein
MAETLEKREKKMNSRRGKRRRKVKGRCLGFRAT